MNLATLVVAPGSYVDADLACSESDLLFTVELQGRRGFVYLLFEHQSSVDDLMPFRILKYVVRILERHVIAAGLGKRALPLPVVVPVVLHHSLSGWTGATRLEALFDEDFIEEASISALIPRLGFVLDDISHLGDEQLRTRALGLVPTLTLWALRDARHPGRIVRSLSTWGSLIGQLAQAQSGVEALVTIFRYRSLVAEDLTPHTMQTTLASVAPEARETLMTTMAEQWKAEGRTEGRVEGARRVLLRQLELKFGVLSAAERARLEGASEQQLERWADRFVSAESCTEVLAD